MNKAKKVLVAGHLCLDVSPAFSADREGDLREIFQPGKLTQVGEATVHLGGVVANTGLALNRFGMDVRLAAKIGRDAFGKMIRQSLEDSGCELNLLEDAQTSSSYSLVIAIPGTDRMFLHNPGANDSFCADDVTDAMLENVDHFHFGYPPLMKKMYENDGAELVSLFRRVKEKGIITSLDMAAIDPASPAGRVDWRRILAELLPMVDYFLPSAEELCYMLESPLRCSLWQQKAKLMSIDVTDALEIADLHMLAEALRALGAGTIMIKCGARGIYYSGSDEEGFEPGFKPDRVVSATGAGDTCIAAFLASILQGEPLKESVRLAAAAGACCVTTYDALSGLPSLTVLRRRIKDGWARSAVEEKIPE